MGEEEKIRRKAVALRYHERQDAAPRIVAKGAGHLAERIIALAREHGIHVQDDPGLAAALSELDLDTEIPEELYRAVAEVLAFVYRLESRMPR